jgi:tetratricopeptide (TPR) repeat protein
MSIIFGIISLFAALITIITFVIKYLELKKKQYELIGSNQDYKEQKRKNEELNRIYSKCIQYIIMEKFPEALKILNSISYDGDVKSLLFVCVNEHLGYLDDAIRALDKINNTKNRADYLLLRGRLYYKKREYDNAENSFIQSITNDNENYTTYKYLANVYFIQKKYKEFKELLHKIKEKFPNEDINDLYNILQIIHSKSGEDVNSEEKAKYYIIQLKEAIISNDINLADEILNNYLYLYGQTEYFIIMKGYSSIYRNVINSFLNNSYLIDNASKELLIVIGHCYFLCKNYEKANEYYKKAILLSNDEQIFICKYNILIGKLFHNLQKENYSKITNSERIKYIDIYNELAYEMNEIRSSDEAIDYQAQIDQYINNVRLILDCLRNISTCKKIIFYKIIECKKMFIIDNYSRLNPVLFSKYYDLFYNLIESKVKPY